MTFPERFHDLPVGADPADNNRWARPRTGDTSTRPGTTTTAAWMAIISGVVYLPIFLLALVASSHHEALANLGYPASAVLAWALFALVFGTMLIILGVAVLRRRRWAAITLVVLALPTSIWAILDTEQAWLAVSWIAVGSLLLISTSSREWLRDDRRSQ